MENNPNILCIETTGEICSVALVHGAECVAVKESNTHNSHAKNMIPFIEDVLSMAEVDKHQLNAVAVSIGPGSYTGLRIGVSTAKGLAFSLNIPVIAVSTLESIAQPYLNKGMRVRPMMDARRMEVFTALFSSDGQLLEEANAKIVDETTFKEELTNFKTIFCGNGVPKCTEILRQFENASVENEVLSARNMASIVSRKFQNSEFEDVAYFEPFYLKDYVAGKPNVKGLHS
ncbi:MAG: tRNA (adenosine(37)-N6)-threonylcarbamoyltransferase complex dimerization subunit type 1 TsaB [Bacteroidales bacterium]|nr:tRNA (adenosine(37)-N6)-threonylcarbamoyltransferase complex dimerization subunit type 1 TsaB [Bacteroidales bacterium]